MSREKNSISKYTPILNTQVYRYDVSDSFVKVTPWMYNKQQLELYINNPAKISTELYEENGEWDLYDSDVEIVER